MATAVQVPPGTVNGTPGLLTGPSEGVSAEAIDALVKRLKRRLRPLQVYGDYIEVVRGRGIRLNAGL